AIGALDPEREAVMDQINDRIDTAAEKVFERFVRETPVPGVRRGINQVPRNSIAGASNAQVMHPIDIFTPTRVMLRQFIFVQRSPGAWPGRCNKRIFNSNSPEKVVFDQRSTGMPERHTGLRFFSSRQISRLTKPCRLR